ncbi:hypothetical protein [Mesorhizobium sp. L-8-3]|uniref:hypothetical protein n=1 Tax=Mesorhizobium sp. L-8-3 TaxID=2744522 RepID=UPI0019258EC3|nr:hypothetical protein [Mesorhizobium sp. L-8-3]BCH22098.1 hypothetical protein MesoLjLb_18830 [Mesorhizobium sp. L-8-3]
MSKEVTFSEPFYVEDKVVAGLALAEEIAPNLFRCAFYSEQRSLYGTRGEKERTIVAKFVLTADALRALTHALAGIGRAAPDDFSDMPATSIHQH